VHRRGVRAAVRVDHEQVHRVGADIQHPEPHGGQSARSGRPTGRGRGTSRASGMRGRRA
jgi:hypothetical protein